VTTKTPVAAGALAIALLAGCALPGGAKYRVEIRPDGSVLIDVAVANDSELVGAKLAVDPETGKVTGLEFSKKGTDGGEALAAAMAAVRAAVEKLP